VKVMELRYYKEVLEEDYRMMGQVVLPSTLKKIEKLKQIYVEKYLRYYVKSRLTKYLKIEQEVMLMVMWIE
jgi:hypothetical protein